MELRQHPRMIYLGRPSWPPEWRGPYGPGDPLPKGEVGHLLRAETSVLSTTPHCVAVMRWNGREYLAFLYFDERDFSQEIIRLLQNWIGQPIGEIGSLEIP